MKEPERALEKINSDYKGDPRQIKDLVRGRFVVDTPEQIVAIKQAILEELDVDSLKDKYAEPSSTTGYRDLNTKVALENGHIAEIQVQQRDMMRVNKPTHDLMEEIQEIDRQAKAENRVLTEAEKTRIDTLENQAIELHNAAAHDGKLNDLVKPELREKFTYTGELDAKGSALGKLAETFSKLGKHGGIVAGVAFGGLAGAFTLAAGGSKAQAAEVAYESSVPYGETSLDVLGGDMNAAKRSATIETVSNVGSVGGAVAGAAVGAAIGSVVPVVGTVAGGIVGGIMGAVGVGVGSGYITEKVYDNFQTLKNSAVNVSHEAAEALSTAMQETKNMMGAAWDWMAGENKPPINLTAVFNGLPDSVTDNMPPEVQALIEVRENSILFEQVFNDLKDHGGLNIVAMYIEDNPLSESKPEQTHTVSEKQFAVQSQNSTMTFAS
ncbi:MAG: RelA/SpoT domain-containing protein [Alphaproteobacteria bacterium]